jgi:iron complex transport system substrate-binding protein
MKTFLKSFLIGIIFCSCTQHKLDKTKNQATNQVKYAQNFKIFNEKKYTEIQIVEPETNRIVKKIRCYSKNKSTLISNTNLIQTTTPINEIVCLSSTHIGMLNKIKGIKLIKGVDNESFISNKQILYNIKNRKTQTVGPIENLNVELLLATKAKYIFYSGFETNLPIFKKLERLGIHLIPTYEWKENNPLGKAEWIKLFGVLTNKYDKANYHFNEIEKKYKNLLQKTKNLKQSKKMLAGSMIGDTWFLPAGESYMAKLFTDAKIDFVAKNTKGSGSETMSIEQCLRNFQNSAFWINVGAKSKTELINANKKYNYFKAFKTNELYCYSKNTNFYWENSSVEPHRLLSDLLIIAHPNEFKGNLYFYRKLQE